MVKLHRDMRELRDTEIERDKYVDHEMDKLQSRADRQRRELVWERRKRDDLTKSVGMLSGTIGAMSTTIDLLQAQVNSLADKLCRCDNQGRPRSRELSTPELEYALVGSTPSPIPIPAPEPVVDRDSDEENMPVAQVVTTGRLVPIEEEVEEGRDERGCGGTSCRGARHTAVRGRPYGRAERRANAHPYRGRKSMCGMALGNRKPSPESSPDPKPFVRGVQYRGHYGQFKSERRVLRSLDRAITGPERGVGGYMSDSESGSSGLSDGDERSVERSASSDVAARLSARAAPSAHAYVRPSKCRSLRKSPGPELVGTSEVVSGNVSGHFRAGGGRSPWIAPNRPDGVS